MLASNPVTLHLVVNPREILTLVHKEIQENPLSRFLSNNNKKKSKQSFIEEYTMVHLYLGILLSSWKKNAIYVLTCLQKIFENQIVEQFKGYVWFPSGKAVAPSPVYKCTRTVYVSELWEDRTERLTKPHKPSTEWWGVKGKTSFLSWWLKFILWEYVPVSVGWFKKPKTSCPLCNLLRHNLCFFTELPPSAWSGQQGRVSVPWVEGAEL